VALRASSRGAISSPTHHAAIRRGRSPGPHASSRANPDRRRRARAKPRRVSILARAQLRTVVRGADDEATAHPRRASSGAPGAQPRRKLVAFAPLFDPARPVAGTARVLACQPGPTSSCAREAPSRCRPRACATAHSCARRRRRSRCSPSEGEPWRSGRAAAAQSHRLLTTHRSGAAGRRDRTRPRVPTRTDVVVRARSLVEYPSARVRNCAQLCAAPTTKPLLTLGGRAVALRASSRGASSSPSRPSSIRGGRSPGPHASSRANPDRRRRARAKTRRVSILARAHLRTVVRGADDDAAAHPRRASRGAPGEQPRRNLVAFSPRTDPARPVAGTARVLACQPGPTSSCTREDPSSLHPRACATAHSCARRRRRSHCSPSEGEQWRSGRAAAAQSHRLLTTHRSGAAGRRDRTRPRVPTRTDVVVRARSLVEYPSARVRNCARLCAMPTTMPLLTLGGRAGAPGAALRRWRYRRLAALRVSAARIRTPRDGRARAGRGGGRRRRGGRAPCSGTASRVRRGRRARRASPRALRRARAA
jgi:hypothetical protein